MLLYNRTPRCGEVVHLMISSDFYYNQSVLSTLYFHKHEILPSWFDNKDIINFSLKRNHKATVYEPVCGWPNLTWLPQKLPTPGWVWWQEERESLGKPLTLVWRMVLKNSWHLFWLHLPAAVCIFEDNNLARNHPIISLPTNCGSHQSKIFYSIHSIITLHRSLNIISLEYLLIK